VRILALDLGTHCGWALGEGVALIGSGTQVFEKTETPGERFFEFRSWVEAVGLNPKVDIIIYEKPLGRWAKSQAQVDLSIGFKTRLEEFAYAHKIELKPVPIATLKKATTGNGHAEKEEMVAAVNRIFSLTLTKKQHDEADALALLHYARQWKRLGNDSIFPQWKREKGDPF
jgi:hypothetical protein